MLTGGDPAAQPVAHRVLLTGTGQERRHTGVEEEKEGVCSELPTRKSTYQYAR